MSGTLGPVLVVVTALMVIWYGFAVFLNTPWQNDKNTRAEVVMAPMEFVGATLSQKRPLLPGPHQIAAELFKTTVQTPPTSKKSLIFHGWITLSSTVLGFAFGTLLGIVLAVAIVHNQTSNRSLMPWIIASQTVPIIAIAPMVIVVLNAVGISGIVPKALISTYLSFFPIVVGMVKGLRAPEAIQLDLVHTYSASPWQTFWKLRWPMAMPYLFTSMKVGIAAALVGAVVAELPTGSAGGYGARLLAGSYYGQTIQIWSALIAAATLAALLVLAVGLTERLVNASMGARP
ncbi:MAG: ABC transporter permease subunit [Alphaproteobacteria bacterium]|nr:ABC transporter permease subunit [Alphaproteobacteria bacterium]